MEKGTTVGCAKIAALFDAGTFVETGAFMKRGDDLTGVVCGYGAVNGKLVYAFAQDSDRKKGAIDALQAEKIAKLYAMAQKNGAPVGLMAIRILIKLPVDLQRLRRRRYSEC